MNFVISQMKALGERNRLRAFLALTATGELCVCQVGELLSLSPATVSRHMSILGAAGLVEWEKRGKLNAFGKQAYYTAKGMKNNKKNAK